MNVKGANSQRQKLIVNLVLIIAAFFKDVEYQYIAFQCPLPAICRMFVLDGDLCLVGASDGILYKVRGPMQNNQTFNFVLQEQQ